jgi:hypothetical protein
VNNEKSKLCQQTHGHCGISLQRPRKKQPPHYILLKTLSSNPTAISSKSLMGQNKIRRRGSSSSFRKLTDAIETNQSERICPFLMADLSLGNTYLQAAAVAAPIQPTKCEVWINHPSRGARTVSWILSSPTSYFNLEYRRLYCRTNPACSNLHTKVQVQVMDQV